MSDMLLSEPLHLLEKGDYVPYVRLIFTILRHVTRLKTLRYYNRAFAHHLQRALMCIPFVRRYAEKHHRFITDRVDERLSKSPNQPDVWSLVTAETATASLISEEERYSIANELMIAGTETSATVLSGCLYHLLKNPTWLSTLTADLRLKYGEGKEEMTMASLQANKLLDATLKEAMRSATLSLPVPHPTHH
jgi:cytochrome P450